jgi:hypothetical protein
MVRQICSIKERLTLQVSSRTPLDESTHGAMVMPYKLVEIAEVMSTLLKEG